MIQCAIKYQKLSIFHLCTCSQMRYMFSKSSGKNQYNQVAEGVNEMQFESFSKVSIPEFGVPPINPSGSIRFFNLKLA